MPSVPLLQTCHSLYKAPVRALDVLTAVFGCCGCQLWPRGVLGVRLPLTSNDRPILNPAGTHGPNLNRKARRPTVHDRVSEWLSWGGKPHPTSTASCRASIHAPSCRARSILLHPFALGFPIRSPHPAEGEGRFLEAHSREGQLELFYFQRIRKLLMLRRINEARHMS